MTRRNGIRNTGIGAGAVLFALFAARPAPALADEIHLIDGRVLEDVEVENETLTEVGYKQGGNKGAIPSGDVLWVEYRRMPTEIDEALGFAEERDLVGALETLDAYVDGQIEKGSERRFKWAPAFAAWKAVELREEMGDMLGVQESAQRLITSFDGSRYVPAAYLAKANAELDTDRAKQARTTLEELAELVASKGLSERWVLECRVAQIRADASKSGEEKRADLGRLAREAAESHPLVAARALVAEGETYLVEADAARGQSEAKSLREKARGVFERAIESAAADDETLAGAYSGLGDCLFYLGADADDAALLKQAVMHYLRVATRYKKEGRYVPRSLFYAMRCFDLMQDRRRMADMKRELASLYPGSSWAEQAEKF